MVATRRTRDEFEKLPVRPGIGCASVTDVGSAGERRRLQLQNGAVLEPGRGASCRATSKLSRLRGLRRMGAGRPLFGLVEPAVLFQRILPVLIGLKVAGRGTRVAAAPLFDSWLRRRADPIAQPGYANGLRAMLAAEEGAVPSRGRARRCGCRSSRRAHSKLSKVWWYRSCSPEMPRRSRFRRFHIWP